MLTRAVVLAHRSVLEGGSELSPTNLAVLRRVLVQLSSAGIKDCCVVDGEHAVELAERLGPSVGAMRIQVLANTSWRRASGSALLIAKDFVAKSSEPVLVVRGDRSLDQESLATLCHSPLDKFKAVIAVAEPPVSGLNLDARVQLSGESQKAAALALDLEPYDVVFTGHAVVTAALLPLLEKFNNPSLEDALAIWVAQNAVRVQMVHTAWPWGIAESSVVADPVEAILASKSHPRYTLLNPGPVNTTAYVKAALVHHDVCHRDSNFSELMVSLTGKLRRIFRGSTDHSICLITGSGTSAMECAISSTIPYDRKVLVIDNGAFGQRLVEICKTHEMDVVHLRYAWGDQVNPNDVEQAFLQHPDISAVAMTHHETSVGLLNPSREIGAICRKYDALLLVDAVSALGAEDIDVVRDNIDICWGSANKCLHAISGVGFLCVSPRVWPKIANVKPRTYYLDLKRYKKYVDELAQTPFTPAVSNYFALDAACSEFLSDGHSARFEIYRERNERMRSGLAALGMVPFTRTGHESHSVVTCTVPAMVEFEELYANVKAKGYIIYACKDVLADRFMQIANMGDMPLEAIDEFLQTLADAITEIRERKMPKPASQSARFRAMA